MIVQGDRWLLLTLLAVMHGGVLLVMVRGGSLAAVPSPPLAMSITAINAPPASPVAALEPKLLPVAVSLSPPPIQIVGENAVQSMAIAVSASGGGCRLAASIEERLRTDIAAKAALARMPRESRSVANAQMLWTGHWANTADVGGAAALDPVRALVADAVRAASPECRDATVTGPQLMFVTDESGTRILGFGSGTWSWSQLVNS